MLIFNLTCKGKKQTIQKHPEDVWLGTKLIHNTVTWSGNLWITISTKNEFRNFNTLAIQLFETLLTNCKRPAKLLCEAREETRCLTGIGPQAMCFLTGDILVPEEAPLPLDLHAHLELTCRSH